MAMGAESTKITAWALGITNQPIMPTGRAGYVYTGFPVSQGRAVKRIISPKATAVPR